jgi:Fe-S oxidoreductase
LDLAERYLRRTLGALREEIRRGTPVVGMEPSCLAVFKDELKGLLPHDDDAERLARNSYHFSAFVHEQGIELPRLERKAIVWGHCHHKATGGIDTEHEVLKSMGVEVEPVSGGCCGLAGSWGFEQGHHEISMECGEQALLPAVRKAPRDTLVIADGFSCKTQIEQAGTGRRALHLAQAIKLAREGERGPLPEDGYYGAKPKPPARVRAARAGAVLAAAAAGAAAALAR